MHKMERNFKACLKEGAATHYTGPLYACNRKNEACPLKLEYGGKEFCRTPLKESIAQGKARAEG